ncbi:MAG: hypothetical protein JXO49_11845 [Deltaproteobacteria bacterium]|nr:hypothetical protein [Candidatus Anaeroferrophillus wilburensis]MBN2890025.1 hypothetical protein [Deltaproteobacteria bacterium]
MKYITKMTVLVAVGVLLFIAGNVAVYLSPEIRAHQRGVLVNLYGEHRGVQEKELQPGKYVWFLSGFNPLAQRVIIVDISESNLELVNGGCAENKLANETGSVNLETMDSEIIKADVSIWYRVIPEMADVFVTSLAADDVVSLIRNTARSVIRNKSGYYEVESIFKGEVKEQIIAISKDGMNEELKPRGLEVSSIEFKKLLFSEEIVTKLTEKTLSAKDIEINKNKTLAAIEASKRMEEEANGFKLAEIQKAEAAKRRIVLASEAQMVEAKNAMEAAKMESEGIMALGKAEAASKRWEAEAYEGDGGERYMRVRIAESLGKGIGSWEIVPENMSITAVAESFEKAINVGLPAATGKKK